MGKKQNGPSAGAVRGFDAGVVVNGGSANNIRNLVVRDNIGPLTSDSELGDGIVLFHSSANSIIDTTSDGLRSRGVPTNVLIRNNVVNGNGIVGIHFDARGNQILDNQAFNNGAWGINTYSGGNSIIRNRTGGNLMVDLFDQSHGETD